MSDPSARAQKMTCPTGAGRPTFESDFSSELNEAIAYALSRPAQQTRLFEQRETAQVDDSTVKFVIRDCVGKPIGFVLASPAAYPDSVDSAHRNANSATDLLGVKLSLPVLRSIASGRVSGRSWALYPYCRPLGRHSIARIAVRTFFSEALIDWIVAIAEATTKPVPDALIQEWVVTPLQALADRPDLPACVSERASSALAQLEDGTWQPHTVFSHNDFWIGNIVLKTPLGFRGVVDKLRIVDWGGASAVGIPLLDLVTLMRSIGKGKSRTSDGMRRIAFSTGQTANLAALSLPAGLGRLGSRRDCFPRERFVALTCATLAYLDRIHAWEGSWRKRRFS